MRYGLRTLLIVLTWVAVVCLALRSPTPFWSLAIFQVTLLAVLTSVLVIIFRQGRTRAGAVGFLVFAAAYLAMAFLPASEHPGGHPASEMASMLYESIYGEWSKRDDGASHITEFMQTVMYCSVTLAGLVGATIAQILYAAPQKEK